jgi:hypothetical protein
MFVNVRDVRELSPSDDFENPTIACHRDERIVQSPPSPCCCEPLTPDEDCLAICVGCGRLWWWADGKWVPIDPDGNGGGVRPDQPNEDDPHSEGFKEPIMSLPPHRPTDLTPSPCRPRLRTRSPPSIKSLRDRPFPSPIGRPFQTGRSDHEPIPFRRHLFSTFLCCPTHLPLRRTL